MSQSIKSNSNGQTLRTMENLRKSFNVISGENANDRKNIISFSATELVISSTSNNLKATFEGMNNAVTNAIEYLVPAQASIEEIQRLLQSMLEISTEVATNPNIGSASDLAVLNKNFLNIIDQIQETVNTTRDASGNKTISGEIVAYDLKAQDTIELIAKNDTVVKAVDADAANKALQAIVDLNLDNNTKLQLDNAAAASTTSKGFGQVLDYLAKAFVIIPNIKIDTSSISSLFKEAGRSAKIIELLGTSLTNARKANGGFAAAANSVENMHARMIANLLGEQIEASSPTQTGAQAPADPADLTHAQSLSSLLTASEKKALRNYALSSVAVGGPADAISTAELRPILKLITCFHSIPGLYNDDIVAAAAGAKDILSGVAAAPAVIADMNTPAIRGNITRVFTNALGNIASKAKPYNIQIGILPSDKMGLKINDMSKEALGVDKVNILNSKDAEAAVEKIKTALQYVANAATSINNQCQQLKSRKEVININIDTLKDKIANINKVDPVTNAAELNKINHSSSTAASMIAMEQAMNDVIYQAAQRILRSIAA